MKSTLLLFFFAVQLSFGQEISVQLIEKVPLKADQYFGTDDYGSVYFAQGAVFYKRGKGQTYQFNDLQLGKPTNADFTNPLKIVLFYQAMNTVVFLDRHLIEIDRIRFNTLPRFRSLAFATLAAGNNLWIFDTHVQNLEVFNVAKTKTLARSQPIGPKILDFASGFNFCWLLTEKTLLHYNTYGSLLQKIEHSGFTELAGSNGHLTAKKKDQLFFLKKSDKNFQLLKLPQIELRNFYLNKENLYIYDGKSIHQFHINL